MISIISGLYQNRKMDGSSSGKPVSHIIVTENDPNPNVIRQLFSVKDTSSAGENCGLVSLVDIVGSDMQKARDVYRLPKEGRLSIDELALIGAKHQVALLEVQVVYSDAMEFSADGQVLVAGYTLSLFIPTDDICGFIVLLNEHGHFSPVHKADGDVMLPNDIITAISSVDNSNYGVIQEIYSDFHGPALKLDEKLRSLFSL